MQVAGTRPGKAPRLFIAARDPWDIPLPIALPDGGIILSKGVLEICYRDPAQGDDRLAFVLAHELAHHLNGDLWHLHFFQALEALRQHGQFQDPGALASLRTVPHTASNTEEAVQARELRADGDGIMYAAMAGFNPRAIVTEEPGVNFFAEWVRAQDPGRLGSVSADRLRPTPKERAEAPGPASDR